MARNIEIKAKVRDEAHIRQYMAANGSSHEVQEQRDVFLRANYGRLKLR
jgi:adenylate cyclase class IV